MDLIKLVPEQLLILVAAVFVIGVFLKRTPKIKDWMIPWILILLGIAGSIGLEGFTVTAVIQGVICVGAAILTNQLIKQTSEGISLNKSEEILESIDSETKVEFKNE